MRTRQPAFAQAGWTRRDAEDLLFYGVLGVVIGGRLGYVLFYKPGYYAAHPLEAFAVWKGGMAFHGGLMKHLELDLGQLISAQPRTVYPDQSWEATHNNKPPARSSNEILIEYTAHPDARFHLPDGTTIPVPELEKTAAGPLTPIAPANQRVRLRVTDKATGKTLAVKLHMHGEAGEYLAPVDRHRIPDTDLDGLANGYSPAQAGSLTVNSSGDTTPPATPTGLTVVSASPAGIALTWDPILGDATLYGYEVRRSDVSGGPYTTLALVTAANYTDTAIAEGSTYYYVVRAVDTSFNRSGDSGEVSATAQLRTVTLVFNVTVPATTDATARSVYIAGFLDRLDGGLPQWNPGGVVLTRVDATHWTITLTDKESVQIEYKFTLGDWLALRLEANIEPAGFWVWF